MEEKLFEIINQQNQIIYELKSEINNLKELLVEVHALSLANSPMVNEEEKVKAIREYQNIVKKKQAREQNISMFK